VEDDQRRLVEDVRQRWVDRRPTVAGGGWPEVVGWRATRGSGYLFLLLNMNEIKRDSRV
jgi:hypothetical protein